MGDFRDREGFLSGSEGGKLGLRSPSGGTFGCLREDFLGSWGILWAPGRYCLRPLDILFQCVWFFYQPVSTFIDFYQFLHQFVSSSITFYEPLAIVLHLFQFLMASTNLYRLVWPPIFTNSYESLSTPINGYQSTSANLYQSLPIPIHL